MMLASEIVSTKYFKDVKFIIIFNYIKIIKYNFTLKLSIYINELNKGVYMKKLLLGFAFLSVCAQANELTQISCTGIHPSTSGFIHFFEPEIRTYKTETCLERQPAYNNECTMYPGPYDHVDECPCIESRVDTHEYKVWSCLLYTSDAADE